MPAAVNVLGKTRDEWGLPSRVNRNLVDPGRAFVRLRHPDHVVPRANALVGLMCQKNTVLQIKARNVDRMAANGQYAPEPNIRSVGFSFSIGTCGRQTVIVRDASHCCPDFRELDGAHER